MNPLDQIKIAYKDLKENKSSSYIPSFDFVVATSKVFCHVLDTSFTVFICKKSAYGKKNSYHTFALAHRIGRCYILGNELPILQSRQIKNKFIAQYNDKKYYVGKNRIVT